MITIDNYTGNWQGALTPTPRAPRLGAHVRVEERADAREWDDFRRVLKADKRDLEWVRWMPRLKMDVAKIIKAKKDGGECHGF